MRFEHTSTAARSGFRANEQKTIIKQPQAR